MVGFCYLIEYDCASFNKASRWFCTWKNTFISLSIDFFLSLSLSPPCITLFFLYQCDNRYDAVMQYYIFFLISFTLLHLLFVVLFPFDHVVDPFLTLIQFISFNRDCWFKWVHQLTFYQMYSLFASSSISLHWILASVFFLSVVTFYCFCFCFVFLLLSFDCLYVGLVVKYKKMRKNHFFLSFSLGCLLLSFFLSCYFDFHFFKHCHIHFNPHHL